MKVWVKSLLLGMMVSGICAGAQADSLSDLLAGSALAKCTEKGDCSVLRCENQRNAIREAEKKLIESCAKIGKSDPAECRSFSEDQAKACAEEYSQTMEAWEEENKQENAALDLQNINFQDPASISRIIEQLSPNSTKKVRAPKRSRCIKYNSKEYNDRRQAMAKEKETLVRESRTLQEKLSQQSQEFVREQGRLQEKFMNLQQEFRRQQERQESELRQAHQQMASQQNEIANQRGAVNAQRFPVQAQISQSYSEEAAKLLNYADIQGICLDLLRQHLLHQAKNGALDSADFFSSAIQRRNRRAQLYKSCIAQKTAEKKRLREQYTLQRKGLRQQLIEIDNQIGRLEASRRQAQQSMNQLMARQNQSAQQAAMEMQQRQANLVQESQALQRLAAERDQKARELLALNQNRMQDLDREIGQMGPAGFEEKPQMALANLRIYKGLLRDMKGTCDDKTVEQYWATAQASGYVPQNESIEGLSSVAHRNGTHDREITIERAPKGGQK